MSIGCVLVVFFGGPLEWTEPGFQLRKPPNQANYAKTIAD
jgi:hypothetical protein